MPVYEYSCSKCGSDFELLVASSQSSASCPNCGSRKLSRKFSTFATHMAASSKAPGCSDGACPAAGERTSPCAGGKCPFA